MALIVPNFSKVTILQILNNNRPAEDLVLHLGTNNITYDETTILGQVEEPTTPDYAPITLHSNAWEYTAFGSIAMSYDPQQFTFTTFTGYLYGYFVTSKETNRLLWMENFTPYEIKKAGDNIVIYPRIEII